MKRLPIVVATLLGLSFTLPQAVGALPRVHAAGVAHHHAYGQRATSARHQTQRSTRRLALLALPRQVTVSGSVQSATQLQLPVSAFPPGSYLYEAHEETAAQADNTKFGSLPVDTYVNLGMQDGWFQYYTMQIPDGLFDVAYLGSYYSSVDAATRAFNNIRANPTFAGGAQCSAGDQCYEDYIGTMFSDGEYRGMLRVVQSSNALMAVISVVPADDLAARVAEIGTNVDRVSAAFLQATTPATPTATPTATPAPATATPISTATPQPTATATSTATPTSTPTNTPIPLFVTLHLAHASVHSGKKQTVAVTTLANASVSVVVTFPDGAKVHGAGTAGADGHFAWTFKQPAGHTTAARRKANVLVTATNGSGNPVVARGSYTIR